MILPTSDAPLAHSRPARREQSDATPPSRHRWPVAAPHAGTHLPVADPFLAAVSSTNTVSQSPHDLYKYPARFAPEFARETIRAFSQPGDVVLDPFCGGGTSVIEAVALGRRAVGYDISALACFLARTKTTPLTVHDERALHEWSLHLRRDPSLAAGSIWQRYDTDDGYYRRNLPPAALGFFSTIIDQLDRLPHRRQRRFARLVLLSVGQRALDCKSHLPTTEEMHAQFRAQLAEQVSVFRRYTWNVARTLGVTHRRLEALREIVRASSEICGENGRPPTPKAALVVTSPPYPGVHMLYHRWQLFGRRETPAPFLIADCRDGDGTSFYCLGNRHEAGLKTYYERLTKAFAAVRRCLKRDALVVQMVAFNQPDWQLPAFLQAMETAGYAEMRPRAARGLARDGRLWRAVPGRRWYAAAKSTNAAGNEVVLLHRPVGL